MMERPKLRHIEAFPMDEGGQRAIVIRDPQGFSEQMLALTPEAFLIVSRFDGTRSAADIQAEIQQQFGQMVPEELIEHLAAKLDECLFLETKRFQDRYREVVEEFGALEVRPPSCAGGSYSNDPEELRRQILDCYLEEEGPGTTDAARVDRPIKALISPHIDYGRGGHCYAHVYRQLAGAPPVDLFIILGTGHAGPKGHFVFTRKDFETPLGLVKTDVDFIDRLEGKLGVNLAEEEFIHKGEHSVELQLVFMQLAYAPDKCPRIVPVLCGGFYEAVLDGKVPSEIPEVKRFLDALQETIKETEGRVCILASADLSHVGPHFGDEEPAEGAFLDWVRKEDLEMLETVQGLDADAFFRTVQKDQDRRRVCGLSSIYALLSVAEVEKCELLKYSQAVAPDHSQAVTFCGAIFL